MSAHIEPGGPITGEKLRWIAAYITECDDIVAEVLRRARAAGNPTVTDEMLEMHDGKSVQADLLRWADEVDRG